KQLTFEGRNNRMPSVCASGYIVYSSNRKGARRIWRMDIDGSNQKQLTSGDMENFPTCSPDGKWVLYATNASGVQNLWKVTIDGGNPVQLTDRFSGRPIISPDGKLIAVKYMKDPSSRKVVMALIPFEGGDPIKLLDIPGFFVHWSHDGRAIQYIDSRGGSSNLWSQPIDGGPPKQLTELKSDRLFSFVWSADGKQRAVSRAIDAEDVVLVNSSR